MSIRFVRLPGASKMESEREALGELLNQTYRRSNSNNANDGTASEREHSQGMAKICVGEARATLRVLRSDL
jgi:hypothetical protein